MAHNKLEKTIVFLFEKVFSDQSKNAFETIILWLSIIGFIVHLALIYLIKLDAITLLGNYKLLTNPISAIYTPFTFILIYEIYLLVLYLPRSFTTALSKQFEIISLIINPHGIAVSIFIKIFLISYLNEILFAESP